MPIYINKQQWILTEEFPTFVASCGGHHEDTAQRRESWLSQRWGSGAA